MHYLCPNVAKEGMEIIFNEKYLQEMYLTGQTDKKHRYQPQVVRKYIRVIDIMIDAPRRVRRTGAGRRNHRYNMQYRFVEPL